MKNAYVVRELVSMASGEKELLTHDEYGTFPTYEAANLYAIRTKNQNCFPQRLAACHSDIHTGCNTTSQANNTPRAVDEWATRFRKKDYEPVSRDPLGLT
jgi:hypothetical protein